MALKINKNVILSVSEEVSLLTDAFYKETDAKLPLVVFCHGYKGFKDWGAWDDIAEYFANEGFYFVKFNFSHNGTSIDNPTEFTDLEAFGRNTYSQEQIDLSAVIAHFKNKPEVDSSKIYLIGHSRGGGTVQIQATENDEIAKIVSWAGVSDYKRRFPQGQRFETWQKEKVFYTLNTRTQQQLPQYFSFYEDFKANEVRFDLQRCAQHLKKPLLIIQGTSDDAVSLKEAELLHLWAKNSTLVVLEGADHVFGTRHPWSKKELPSDLMKTLEETAAFLKKE